MSDGLITYFRPFSQNTKHGVRVDSGSDSCDFRLTAVHSESQFQLADVIVSLEEGHLEPLARVLVGAGEGVALPSIAPRQLHAVSTLRRLPVEVERPLQPIRKLGDERHIGGDAAQGGCAACEVLKRSGR